MFTARRKTVRPGIERVKTGVRLENNVDLSGDPPARRRGVRENSCGSGFLGFRAGILRLAPQRYQQARQNECYKQQL
jgi:hypothetical protein